MRRCGIPREHCRAVRSTCAEAVEHWTSPTAGNNIDSRCLKREATPEDLTGVLIFLAAADSDFMTGQTIVVDGGSVTH